MKESNLRKMFRLPTWSAGVGLEAGRHSGLLLWSKFQTMVALSRVAEMKSPRGRWVSEIVKLQT